MNDIHFSFFFRRGVKSLVEPWERRIKICICTMKLTDTTLMKVTLIYWWFFVEKVELFLLNLKVGILLYLRWFKILSSQKKSCSTSFLFVWSRVLSEGFWINLVLLIQNIQRSINKKLLKAFFCKHGNLSQFKRNGP